MKVLRKSRAARRALSVLVATVFCILSFTLGMTPVHAASGVTWDLSDDGVLTVSGSGTIGDNAFKGRADISSVVIGSGVTGIGYSSFSDCTGIESVELPDGMTNIGEYAFYGCESLGEVTLPSKLKVLETGAFEGCPLTEITIPSSLQTAHTETVGSGPFCGCEDLREVTFAGSRETIPDYLFKESGVESIYWPKELKSIGVDAFSSCVNLESLQIPEGVTQIEISAFEDCENLSQVSLPSTLKDLGSYAFSRCNMLTEITIPASLETANTEGVTSGPFSGCENLRKATINGPMETIPETLFAESGIRSVKWPEGLKTIKFSAFENCTKLNSIQIPEGVETIESFAFSECTALRSISFPETLASIGHNAFADCTSLASATIPDSVTSLGSRMFVGCTELRKVNMGPDISDLSYELFDGADKCEVYAPMYSVTAQGLIEQDYNCSLVNTGRADAGAGLINYNRSSVQVSDSSNSGFIPVIVKYCVKDESSLDSTRLEIRASESSAIADIKGDGCIADPDSPAYENRFFMDISAAEGTATVYLGPNQYGKVALYARIVKETDGEPLYDLIGAVSETAACLTLGTEENVSFTDGASSVKTNVRGLALKGEDVEIYVDDDLSSTVKADKTGSYKTTVTLSDPEDYKIYKIKAVSRNASGEEVSTENTVSTVLEAPVLTEATMDVYASEYPGGHKAYDMLSMSDTINYIICQPGMKCNFEVKYTHPEKIAKVLIVSTRNGERKLLPAEYNESTGTFRTNGFFDDDPSYTPGSLSIEYISNESPVTLDENEEIVLSAKDRAQLPDKWKDVSVDVIEDSDTHYEAELTLGDGNSVIMAYDAMSYTDFAQMIEDEYINGDGPSTVAGDLAEIKGDPENNEVIYNASGSSAGTGKSSSLKSSPLKAAGDTGTKERLTKDELDQIVGVLSKLGEGGKMTGEAYDALKKLGFVGYLTGEDDINEDIQGLLRYDISDKDLVSYIINPSQEKNNIVRLVYKQVNTTESQAIGEMLAGGDAALGGYMLSSGKALLDVQFGMVSAAQEYLFIMADPNLTEAQKRAKVDKLVMEMEVNLVKTTVNTMLGGVTKFGGPVGKTIGKALDKIFNKVILPKITKDHSRWLRGIRSKDIIPFKWLIDPSGFVYEGVTDNRLGGVTATLYYKESEDSGEVLWNAAEYGQENPLTTDAKGAYAWDVPEGLWKVVYTKDGYETAESDWLTVPPPQTDVNIGMIPEAAPEIKDIKVFPDFVTIQFTQYMDPATISNIRLTDSSGKAIGYSIAYEKSEKDESGKVFAKTFTLNFKGNVKTENVTVTVPETVTSFCGKGITEVTRAAATGEKIALTVSNNVHVAYGEEFGISYSLEGASADDLNVSIDDPEIVELVGISGSKINVKGLVYGSTVMKVSVGDNGIEKYVAITVDEYNKEETSDPEPDDPGYEPDDPDPGHEHTWDAEYTVDKEATCEEDGSESIHCTECGQIKEGSARAIAALGHTWGEWEHVSDSTCSVHGQDKRTCSVCEKSETRDLDLTEHTPAEEPVIAEPTCETDGSRSIVCSVCGAVISSEVTAPALGHDWEAPVYTWSADSSSVTAVRSCRNDSSHTESETVATSSKVTTAATYTTQGKTTYTAVFSNPAFSTQTKTLTNIAKLAKKANPMTIKVRTNTVRFAKLRKKNQTIAVKKAFTVSKAQGKVTYKVAAYDKKAKKKITVNSAGKVTVKKGLKKGTYKVKVKVTAAGNTAFLAKSKTVKLTIKVK